MTGTELPGRKSRQAQHDEEAGSVDVLIVESSVLLSSADDEEAEVPAVAGHRPREEPSGGGGGVLLKPVAETTHRERIAAGVGIFAVLSALIAVVVEQSALVLLAGVVNALLGPYLYYQETRWTDIATLQETNRSTEAEVNRLVHSNLQLDQNMDDLTRSLDRLQEIEQVLSVVQKKSGTTVQEFAKQVEENKNVLKRMKGNLKSRVLQNLISVILRSDVDRDFVIDETEVTDMIHRISNIAGVRIDETKFRTACQGASVPAVMEMVKNLLRTSDNDDDLLAANECIFRFDHDR